jgi:hypothetical protein
MLLSKLKIVSAVVLSVGLASLALAAAALQPTAEDRPPSKENHGKKAEAREGGKSAETLRLPQGPAPVQVLVRLGRKGQLAVRTATTKYRAVQALDGAGNKVTVYLPEAGTTTRSYDLDEVRIYDTAGKKMESKALPGLLTKEIPALASADGKKVDPLHLRLIKEGTLILILPETKLRPPAPVFGAGMPGMGGPPAMVPGPVPIGRPGGRPGPGGNFVPNMKMPAAPGIIERPLPGQAGGKGAGFPPGQPRMVPPGIGSAPQKPGMVPPGIGAAPPGERGQVVAPPGDAGTPPASGAPPKMGKP